MHLRIYMEESKKKSGHLLARAAQILFNGDQFQAIEKMVTRAERE
jgi:hypothetical protein